jgi:predicted anti-sigma-YlaC factor YlaD
MHPERIRLVPPSGPLARTLPGAADAAIKGGGPGADRAWESGNGGDGAPPSHHIVAGRNARSAIRVLLAGLLAGLATGCSINQIVANKVGDALAGGGGVFASDNDPQLVKDAVPFSLKLMESLLAESPRHRGLLFATSSGFTQYAYAFVQQDADELEGRDVEAAQALRVRARRLYLRARDYALRGLDTAHPDFSGELRTRPRAAGRLLQKSDVPLAYWAAASWGAAIALGKDDPSLIAEIPQMEALIDRALELDESWDNGSIHTFLITYEMSRSGVKGDPAERARSHFDRALELTGGRQAGPFVALAEAVCIEKQDAAQFELLLNRALAVDPDAAPEFRLANLVMQRRARWLLSKKDDLFLSPAKPAGN